MRHEANLICNPPVEAAHKIVRAALPMQFLLRGFKVFGSGLKLLRGVLFPPRSPKPAAGLFLLVHLGFELKCTRMSRDSGTEIL